MLEGDLVAKFSVSLHIAARLQLYQHFNCDSGSYSYFSSLLHWLVKLVGGGFLFQCVVWLRRWMFPGMPCHTWQAIGLVVS